MYFSNVIDSLNNTDNIQEQEFNIKEKDEENKIDSENLQNYDDLLKDVKNTMDDFITNSNSKNEYTSKNEDIEDAVEQMKKKFGFKAEGFISDLKLSSYIIQGKFLLINKFKIIVYDSASLFINCISIVTIFLFISVFFKRYIFKVFGYNFFTSGCFI